MITLPDCESATSSWCRTEIINVNLSTIIQNERFNFRDLREVFAKANEEKSGDQLAGIAAQTERERIAAKQVLAEPITGRDRPPTH